jgi:hypothetical protein
VQGSANPADTPVDHVSNSSISEITWPGYEEKVSNTATLVVALTNTIVEEMEGV